MPVFEQQWFGRTREEMKGVAMKELLGPPFEKNLSYIKAALAGERQVFERQITLVDGEVCEILATYIPDKVEGAVRGFYAHMVDVTPLKIREAALEKALRQRDQALAEVHALQGLLQMCAGCKSIKDDKGNWHSVEHYVSSRSSVQFSHGLCPKCLPRFFRSEETVWLPVADTVVSLWGLVEFVPMGFSCIVSFLPGLK